MKSNPSCVRGFSLLETILYVSLLAVVGASFVLFALNVSGAMADAQARALADGEWRRWWQTLEQEIAATATLMPLSGETSDELRLQRRDGQEVRFRLANGRVGVIVGGGPEEIILGDALIIEALRFRNLGTGNQASLEVETESRSRFAASGLVETRFILGER